MLKVSELFIYPVKSLGGIEVTSALLTDRGFEFDRRWMLVDESGRFLSQREFHQMALLVPHINDEGVQITHKLTGDSFTIPFPPYPAARRKVSIWNDTCDAQPVSPSADEWFSRQLGLSCHLVHMPDASRRLVDTEYAHQGEITSFSDAYPLLLIGQASLDDLNSRLEKPIPMNRFRPNIVFTGGTPFLEDEMEHLIINGIDLFGVKLCARCQVPGIDQDTAEMGKEPNRTLAGYRQFQHKILFGQNLLYKGTGTIHAGDTVILKKKKGTPFEKHDH